MSEVKIINDSYNLLKWSIPIVAKYPRNYRYSLGLRIENGLYDFLEFLQKAYHGNRKHEELLSASLKLENLRLLIRLSKDFHLFDERIHHAFIEQTDSIGKQLGGWIKSISE